MSIVMRIYLGMSAMIALIVVVGVFASYQTSNLANTFVEYRATARQSLVAAEIMEDTFEARMASGKYRLTKDPQYVEAVRSNIAEIAALANQDTAGSGTNEGHEIVDDISEMLAQYVEKMDAAAELQQQREELVKQSYATGLKAREQLSEVMETALKDNDAAASSAAGLAATNLLLGRLYLEKFLVSNDAADAERSTQEIDIARQGLIGLMKELQNPRRRELTQSTMEDLDAFDVASTQVADVILARNALYSEMDQIGPEMLQRVDTALEAVVDRQNTLGPEGAAMAQRSIMIVAAFVGIGTLVGAVLAFLTGRIVARNLTKITQDMRELADGNLDVEILPSEDQNEIGKMNNAMVVFLDNARKARDLNAEVKEKEAREREREAADRAREAEMEEERRAAEDQEREKERARMQTLESFQKDMERVLGEAALGNFSNRMSDGIQDAGLVALAQVINQLLDTTETNINDIVKSIDELSKGNLGTRIDGDRKGVFLQMKDDFNGALAALSQTMAQITDSGQSVSGTSSELEASASEMAKRSETNAAAVEETSSAIDQISASIKQVVSNAQAANDATQKVRESADKTREVSRATEDSINAMTEASAQINSVVKVIEDIAFQINLLALNAGVEAARAGEAGRGFSVVASEVRALAQRSQEAVQEIGQVIEQNNRSVEVGVEKVGLSRQALEGIVAEVEVASGQIAEIASAVEQQALGIDEVNSAIRSIDTTTQRNTASLEEMTAASVSLSGEARSLASALQQFRGVPGQQGGATAKVVNMGGTQPPARPQEPMRKVAGGGGMSNVAPTAPAPTGWEEF